MCSLTGQGDLETICASWSFTTLGVGFPGSFPVLPKEVVAPEMLSFVFFLAKINYVQTCDPCFVQVSEHDPT
jgi:hypothetical protein